jgi:F-type H+-transporting ATPase subunit delta
MLNFLKVVARHDRLGAVRAILQSARKLYNELKGRVEVRVETAGPLSNPLRDQIVARLTQMLGREVVLTTEVNNDLIGGLVVRIGDTVYDGSLAARLKNMQEVTVEHTKQSIRQSLEKFAVST